jgi:ATP-dependent DNA helicase DinG
MRDLADIFGLDGPLARLLPGFRPRQSQLQLAERVAEALAERRWLVAEAGTGTGKTFAYLVPALLSGKRVIVSTGTRTLQDQLFHRDLPLLNKALGRGVSIALLKGRANYLCRERLLRMPQELPLSGTADSLTQLLHQWAGQTLEGDLAELAQLPDGHPLRERVTSTRDSCTANRCAEFSRCHVFAARRRANEAEIVVVNHHLLLADLALKEEGYGDILPTADAIILDEAHQLPELAAQFFGVNFSSRAVDSLLEDLPDLLLQSGFELAHLATTEKVVRDCLRQCVQEASRAMGPGGRSGWDDNCAPLDAAAVALVNALSGLSDALRALEGGDLLLQAAVRATELSGDLDAVAQSSTSDGARLLAQTSRGFTCQLVPFNVGPKLRAILESRPMAWVFTSATLAVGKDFSHFAERMGLADRYDSICIESPFDYARQALLYLPTDMPDPASVDYTDQVIRHAAQLIAVSGGGAFVLFTSHRALAQAARLLRLQWSAGGLSYQLLVQGESPREQLLRDFRQGSRAVLLGTASFWEGVDVKGSALRLVIIDRLPFNSPDDPVTKARVQHSRSNGGNPFSEFQLPEAALALKQGVGRLIRSEDDEGVVVICDPRLTSKGYGKTLLAALPPMRRTRERGEASDFLTRIVVGMQKTSRS